jgi:hypothetical protein
VGEDMRIDLSSCLKCTWIVIAGLCLASSSLGQGNRGSVCLGDNLSKLSAERGRHVYVRVDESPKLYFTENPSGPRLAVEGRLVAD